MLTDISKLFESSSISIQGIITTIEAQNVNLQFIKFHLKAVEILLKGLITELRF